MKKLLSILSVMALLLCLSACNQNSSEPTDPSPSDTQPTTEPVTEPAIIDPSYKNLYSISMPITVKPSYTGDNTLIFQYTYQFPHLIMPDRDVAEKIIINFLERKENHDDLADELLSNAASANHATSSFVPYAYSMQNNTTRIDQGVLSIYGKIIQTGDAAHTTVQPVSASYDMVTGDVLTLGSILYHADVKDDLTQLVIETLEESDLALYDDFRDSVRLRFSRDESTDESFYFTTQGLCFYFSPYEIAPYSSGIVTVELPYNKLTGIIGDGFFPAERTISSGTICVNAFEDADLESYEQFADIIVDEESTKVLLSTDGIVQDIRIEKLSFLDGTDNIKDVTTVFASNGLSPTESILLEADFTGQHPDLILSYYNGEVFNEFYLTQDPATGEVILINAK